MAQGLTPYCGQIVTVFKNQATASVEEVDDNRSLTSKISALDATSLANISYYLRLSYGISSDTSRVTADNVGSPRLSILTLMPAMRSMKTDLFNAACSLSSRQETMFIHLSIRKRRMVNLVEMVLMGIVATLFMDMLSILFGKLKIIRQLIGPEVVGRWSLYTLRGKFIHKDIHKTPALNHEKSAALLSHYLIGIALAGVCLFLELNVPTIRHQLLMPLIFGIATVLLPWLWLYPSIGLGFLASKSSRRSPYIVTSLVNHTNFGLGLVIWIAFFRRFLV